MNQTSRRFCIFAFLSLLLSCTLSVRNFLAIEMDLVILESAFCLCCLTCLAKKLFTLSFWNLSSCNAVFRQVKATVALDLVLPALAFPLLASASASALTLPLYYVSLCL